MNDLHFDAKSNMFRPGVRVLVLGDVMLDGYARGDVERISPEAPVPVLRHLAHHNVAGGSANVAMNIAALGGEAWLVGLVGDDEEADQLEQILADAGVVAELVRDSSRPTISKVRILAGNHQMLRIDKEDTRPVSPDIEVTLLDIALRLLPRADVVILSDYMKGCLTDLVIADVIKAARQLGIPLLVDPKRQDFSTYRGAAMITPNRVELMRATGIACVDNDTSRRAAHKAMDVTGAAVLLTLSEKGMAYFSPDGKEIHLPADVREVFDVSGAGDTVIACLACALASGLSVEQALRIANCAAGIAVGKAGTATVSESEIRHMLENIHAQNTPARRIVGLQEAVKQREAWRCQKLTVGFANGCFDLLHPGHIELLRQASSQCDRLIVALNSDDSVYRLKGPNRPIQDESARTEVMAAIRFVDLVILFEEDTPLHLIEALRPDILVKGSDYTEHEVVGADVVKRGGGRVMLAELVPGRSTTILVAKSRGVE